MWGLYLVLLLLAVTAQDFDYMVWPQDALKFLGLAEVTEGDITKQLGASLLLS